MEWKEIETVLNATHPSMNNKKLVSEFYPTT